MSEPLKGPLLPIAVIGVLALVAGGYYYWVQNERDATQTQTKAAPEVPANQEPPIRYPLHRAEEQDAKPLPLLAESDQSIEDAAASLIGRESLEGLFNLNSFVRRFVVTVDDLPRKKISQRYNIAKPAAGHFLVAGKGDDRTISQANQRRYTPYVKLFEAVDAKKLVTVYAHFYPLLQEEYRNLGYPKKYFNDRVVDAIDDLLAAPDIKTAVKVTQPKVLYEYADPNLEALSAGQKLMLRIGPDNAARVKAKLQEIRREITASGK